MTNNSYLLQSPRYLRDDRALFFGLLIVLATFYMSGLGSYGLYDPWETHYGEVARNMVEYDNYIDPWWGSPWDTDDVKREREGFYSKPPLIMWMMSAGMNLLGFNEWGVRLFFPMLSILAVLAVFLAVSRFRNRRAGLFAAAVCATSPFFALLSRQAVTDGPMVSIMTAGIMFLTLGLFYADDDERASPALYWVTIITFAVVVAGQLWVIWPMDRSPDVIRDLEPRSWYFWPQVFLREVFDVGRGKGWVIVLLLLPVAAVTGWRIAKERRRRMFYIYLFYICCGLTVPAKGWLGWMPAGGAIIGYLIITWEWRILSRVDIVGGLLIVAMTGHPWIVAMYGGHHPAWHNRFILHDHWYRLTQGVHSIDDGGFDYFFKWIGYGMFPWIGLLPAAIARVLGLRKGPDGYTRQQKFELFILLWAVIAFFALSRSSTKFHHYILPAIPAFAILIGLLIEDLIEGRGRGSRVLIAGAMVVTVWVGQDLYRMPKNYGDATQNVVNLFTYKYDREWPKYTAPAAIEKLPAEKREDARAENDWLLEFSHSLIWIMLTALAGLFMMLLFRDWRREYGATVVAVAGIWCGYWCLHDYLPKVAVHWSQRGLWDAYYEDCTKFGPDETAEWERHMVLTASRVPNKPDMFPRQRCREPIIAFRTNWRGETFQSANTVMPSIETKYLKSFLKQWSEDRPFYLFTERSRIKSEFEPNIPAKLKKQYREIPTSNNKFVLLKIEPGVDQAPAPAADSDAAVPSATVGDEGG